MQNTNGYSQRELDRAKSDGELASDIKTIKDKVTSMEKKLDSDYITRFEFDAFKKSQELPNYLIFGTAGLILVSFLGIMINMVMKANT